MLLRIPFKGRPYEIQYLYQVTDQESQDMLVLIILAKVPKLENISKKDNK